MTKSHRPFENVTHQNAQARMQLHIFKQTIRGLHSRMHELTQESASLAMEVSFLKQQVPRQSLQ